MEIDTEQTIIKLFDFITELDQNSDKDQDAWTNNYEIGTNTIKYLIHHQDDNMNELSICPNDSHVIYTLPITRSIVINEEYKGVVSLQCEITLFVYNHTLNLHFILKNYGTDIPIHAIIEMYERKNIENSINHIKMLTIGCDNDINTFEIHNIPIIPDQDIGGIIQIYFYYNKSE